MFGVITAMSILTFLMSLFMFYVALEKYQNPCPPRKIEYRFIPRTYQEEVETPVSTEKVYTAMFNDQNFYRR